MNNDLLKDMIEFCLVDDLIKISNPFFKQATDLDDGTDTLFSLDEVFTDIKKNGMRYPLFIGIGINTKKMRLETGNQRVQIFKTKGIKYIPIIAYVSKSHITHTGNGVHQGLAINIKPSINLNILEKNATHKFMKLSQVLKND